LQIATFSDYSNVVRYATQLQGKWFKNLMVKMDRTTDNHSIYKVLIGPFIDKNAAVSYQQFAKKQGVDGFIVNIEEDKGPTPITLKPMEPQQAPTQSAPARQSAPITSAPATTTTTTIKSAPTSASTSNIIQTGEASYYHKKFHGRTTAYGEKYNKRAMTAAHWTLPYNSKVKVCRLDNNKCVVVRINDRGPNPAKAISKDGQPRILDLSTAAAKEIDLIKAGVAQISIELLN
jgi:rare lipoprotein A